MSAGRNQSLYCCAITRADAASLGTSRAAPTGPKGEGIRRRGAPGRPQGPALPLEGLEGLGPLRGNGNPLPKGVTFPCQPEGDLLGISSA